MCRYFNTWRGGSSADLATREAAALRCSELTSRLLALTIGSRGVLPLATMERHIRVS